MKLSVQIILDLDFFTVCTLHNVFIFPVCVIISQTSLLFVLLVISFFRLQRSFQESNCFVVVAKYLHLSDLSYSFYCLFIGTCTFYFRTHIPLKDTHWKKSLYVLHFKHFVYFFSKYQLRLFLSSWHWLDYKSLNIL